MSARPPLVVLVAGGDKEFGPWLGFVALPFSMSAQATKYGLVSA